MVNSVDLKKLKFGSDDAERDSKNGFLGKVFLKTYFYNRLREGERELVVGRKGSGKSALCLALKSALEEEGRSVVLVTPKLLSVPKIQQLKVNSISREESYILSWKYVLLVKVAFELIELVKKLDLDIEGQNKNLLKEVKEFLSENGEIKKSFWKKLVGGLNVFKKISAKVGIFDVGFEANNQQSQIDAANLLEKFEENLENLLTSLKRVDMTILIDRIDEVWSSTEESELIVIGLINAIHDLNSTLHNTRIVLFLRSDIYDILQFNDADKLRNLEERIIWSEVDLKQLIVTRGKISLGFSITEVDTLWKLFFEEKVNGDDSFKYILDRTLKRPRELIQFCNLSLTLAQNKGQNKITKSVILEAEGQYSNWKLNDLASEFLVQYPFLRDFLALFQGFQPSFTRDEFEQRYGAVQKKLTKQYPELYSFSANSILQVLFRIGFLGAKIDGNSIYFYDDPMLILPQCELIVVHPAFHLALGIRDYTISIGNITQVIRGDQNIINIGGDIQIGGQVNQVYIGSIRNLADISNQLESSIENLSKSGSDKAKKLGLLLSDIQQEVERNSAWSTGEKAEILEQLITLAEAGQHEEIEDSRSSRMTRTAARVLRGIIGEFSQKDIASQEKYRSLLNEIIAILDFK
jgi:archaellum biogenesis ATPase FlaH